MTRSARSASSWAPPCTVASAMLLVTLMATATLALLGALDLLLLARVQDVPHGD